MFDMDYWRRPDTLLGPSTLDIFDPFDELDRQLSRNLMWVDIPEMLQSVTPSRPRVPKKYRITVNCRGFDSRSIKTQVSDDKTQLIVCAKEGSQAAKEGEDYTLRELRRTYNLPQNVETDKLVSFMTGGGKLVIEMPMKREEKEEEFPRIVEEKGGQKAVEMNMVLPKNIDPSKVQVTCKDRDLIVSYEERQEKPDETSQVYFYRRSTLPENTDFNNLKCTLDNNTLSIKAPVHAGLQHQDRAIPIEMIRKEQGSITGGQQQPGQVQGKGGQEWSQQQTKSQRVEK